MSATSWNPFNTDGFVPRWECGQWSDELGWLHIVSDLATWSAYTAIPIALIYFIRKRKDVPFHRLFWLFGAFILACGSVHLIEAIIFWVPVYRLSGWVKLATAIISWATVVALVRLLPMALSLPAMARSEKELRHQLSDSRESEGFVRSVLDSVDSAIAVFDSTAQPLATNRAWRTLWSSPVQKSDVMEQGRPPTDHSFHFAAANRTLSHGIERVIQEQFATRIPDLQMNVGEATKSYLVSISPLGPNGGGAVVSCTDITPIKDLERQLVEALATADEANRAKTLFLAGISHELRTPLTAIIGLAEELDESVKEREEKEAARLMRTQGLHLLQLVNDLLDLSRIETGHFTVENRSVAPMDIVRDVVSTMSPVAEAKGIALKTRFPTPVPRLLTTDPLRYKQILLNLVGNAVKFTHEGSVTVVASVSSTSGSPAFLVDVVDTGAGISEPDQVRIFEPFVQARTGETTGQEGVGLGLALCKHFVQLLGGTLSFESALGKGTTFHVSLPLSAREASELKDPKPPDLTSQSSESRSLPKPRLKGRVLIAEDTRAIQYMLQRFLAEVVDEVVTVSDGRQALEALRLSRETKASFDLILLDMQMPVMDGYQTVAHLRAENVTTPVIALTASVMEGDREACLQAGCDEYLAKPIDRSLLYGVLCRILPEA